ncbi:hypothetical protein CONLIGDRAFT_645876 [Coniochaeta ligniaria NRRL 30616]|uniref:Uncharacterized protein n=1 Tax=Coniochaeta ligniaria NRRL 30616 TaxID=1408157 RepID=A0A1J7IK17_9PEZI|nr:hypothetical protein CONLIGDRAFT_645876 [Coniochaeta ligniaria NRRL 30616]
MVDITDAPHLPPVPILEGKQNFSEWNNLVIMTLEHFGVAEELFRRETGGRRSAQRSSIFNFIRARISKTMIESFKNRGTARDYDEDDAHDDLYDDIYSSMFPRPPRTPAPQVLREFSRLDSKDYPTLRNFQARVQALRHQLVKWRCDLGDTPAIWFVLNGLKARYPTWHRSLTRQMHAKKLTWPWLMVEMASEAFHEIVGADIENNGDTGNARVIEIEIKDETADNGNGTEATESAQGRKDMRSKRQRVE